MARQCSYTCLSVILFKGGVFLSACWDTHTPWQTPPPSRADTLPLGRTPSKHAPPGQTPPAKANGYCCGWYASYWNAFLLLKSLSNIVRFLSRNCLFERINSLQWCELTRRCSHLPLKLASPFTYAVHQW